MPGRPTTTGRLRALGLVARSVARVARLATTGRITMPRERVGAQIPFADGSTSVVFRETRLAALPPSAPCYLAVSFQLAGVGHRRWAHWVFRHTCVVNTPLFAGFEGFRDKLWLADVVTSTYRGLYLWDGAAAADEYARALSRVLALVCARGSTCFHIVADRTLEDMVSGGGGRGAAEPDGSLWWQPTTAG